MLNFLFLNAAVMHSFAQKLFMFKWYYKIKLYWQSLIFKSSEAASGSAIEARINTNTSGVMSVVRDHAAPASAQMWAAKRAHYAAAAALLQQLHPKTNRPLQQPYHKQQAYTSCPELMWPIIRLMGCRLMLTCQQSSYRWDLQVGAEPSII